MPVYFVAALLFLCSLVAGFYGAAVRHYQIWPYDQFVLVKNEVRYVWNDFTGGEARSLLKDDSRSRSDFRPLTGAVAFGLSRPQISMDGPADGYTLLHGKFDLANGFNAAVLLDPQGMALQSWALDENSIQHSDKRSAGKKYPHGIQMLPDGSIVFAFDNGVSLQRLDACGGLIWSIRGHFHHAVALTEDRSHVWTLLERKAEQFSRLEQEDDTLLNALVRIRVSDGAIVQEIPIRSIVEANPRLGVFGAHQKMRDSSFGWAYDPFHINDIEPLPSDKAEAFPGFAAGDLLISMRSLNLVFVVSPETYKIKWFSMGYFHRQHDPDWQADGTITLLDNSSRLLSGFSHIISLDPEQRSAAPQTVLAGDKADFYTRQRGKHQVTRGGTHVLVASSQQGRIFEVDQAGNVVFEIINQWRDDPGKRFIVSDAIRLPMDYLNEDVFDRCAGPSES